MPTAIISFLSTPAFVEVAQTTNGSVGAYFPASWLMTGAISSPILMLLLWIFKEWWDEHKGWKKEVKSDMKWLRENFHSLQARVGDDLDEKIERKIKHAFELAGRRR
jgi:hypothetical protein